LLSFALGFAPLVATAQPPQYTPQFLGAFTPGRINAVGEIIGSTMSAGALRGLVVHTGQPLQLLPLPAGMMSSRAVDINDLGVIVGAVGPFSSPEFSSQAARWTPDGSGGFAVDLLGALPGQSISSAAAVNNLGDVVGYSSNGTFRYPVWFTAPGGVMDLSFTGVFDPVDINEQRVLVDQSFTVNRLDLDTMIAENLGVPGPNPFGTNYLATQSAAINESGQVAGAAILATSTSCDREPARYTDGVGWEVFAGCGPYNGAGDINDLGDITMTLNLVAYVRLEGQGTFVIQDAIVNTVGQWFPYSNASASINNAREMVISASNSTTGESGALLLIPAAATGAPSVARAEAMLDISSAPNPFRPATTIRYVLPRADTVTLTIHDVTGRLVRHLVAGEQRNAGPHEVRWDSTDDRGNLVSSGVYFGRLGTAAGSRTSRLVRMR
jgi:hypothetical protein